MGIKVKLDLDADTTRLTEAVQKALSAGFGGGSSQGLATSPTDTIRQLSGGGGKNVIPSGARGGVPPDWYLRQGTQRLAGLGPLFPMPPIPGSVAQPNNGAASFIKNVLFAANPVLRPGNVFGNLFAARQLFSGLSGTKVGQNALGAVGLSGVGGAALATGGIMGILLAVGASLKALSAIIKETIASYDQARKLYAKSLLSGLGLQFTIGRGNLANVLGVSEKEVFQFGAAVAYIGPKLKFATDVMAKTTPNLTSVAWEFNILKTNLEAMFFTIANDAAPALRRLLDGFSQLTVEMTLLYGALKPTLNFIMDTLNSKVGKIFVGGLAGALVPGGGAMLDFLKSIGTLGKDSGAAPSPSAMMKQLPVSAFERMGFITGRGAMDDYARRTAAATEDTAKALNKLLMGGIPGIPGSNLGFSNATSNP